MQISLFPLLIGSDRSMLMRWLTSTTDRYMYRWKQLMWV